MESKSNNHDVNLEFQNLKRILQSKYEREFCYVSPLPWKKGFTLQLDHVFIEREGHLMIKEKGSWRKHDQWIDVDAVSLMALSFHYQRSTQSIITVEGKMGTGKTTLCKQILKEWCCGNLDIMEGICILYINVNGTKDFASYNGKDISKYFELSNRIEKSRVSKILFEKQEEVVVFVDINKAQSSVDWIHNLCNKLLPKAKFIIFCRPDMSYKLLDLSYVKILLQGFDNNKINKLLEKLSPDFYIQYDIFDAMIEDENLMRLCGNPFICTAFIVTCKEQLGVKFIDNAVMFVKTVIGFIWKRFVCENRTTSSTFLKDLDILMTSLSGVSIDLFEKEDYLCETDVMNIEHGPLLLESGLLYLETYNPDLNTNKLYSFFDIIINEYACALHFSQTLLKSPEERKLIGTILRNTKWRNICRLTACILKERANILIDQLISERLEDVYLKTLCECVHESGYVNISKFQLNDKLFEDSLDLSAVDVNSCTLKGSCITNRNMVELMRLVNSCNIERLYLMSDAGYVGYSISNKIVDSFVCCILDNLTHVTLNDHHLGEYWMKTLCGVIKEKSRLQSIIVSVSCVHELSVESAMNLVQSMKRNILVENVELYCGIQPMVIMTLFNFYRDILAKDERLNLVFL